eukprot:CAMPEP_0197076154 /NCGR_PEP_ID=MMETSP1384-20130603/211972_1 /TAXON_ID=29189 /ORGANISM="Ammonia sp." /LENGTH=649 /DNA_ID=CAMNT_0042515003 /DNA_START=87 /DNA_END=2036 /DNA_ORIENTATION=-
MSDSASQDSSLDSRDSPSIDMDNHRNNNNNSNNEKSKSNPNNNAANSNIANVQIKQQPMDSTLSHFNDGNHFLLYPNLKPENEGNHSDHDHNHDHDIDIEMEIGHKTPGSGATTDFHNFLMMGLEHQSSTNAAAQFAANMSMQSPTLDFQNNLNENINITPSLNALTNGLFDLSTPNTPHLPPLSIDANSHLNSSGIPHSHSHAHTTNTTSTAYSTYNTFDSHYSGAYPPPLPRTLHHNDSMEGTQHSTDDTAMPYISALSAFPNIPQIGNSNADNIAPPTAPAELDWHTFYKLIERGQPLQADHADHNEMPPLVNALHPNEFEISPHEQHDHDDHQHSNSKAGRKRKKLDDNDNETNTTPSASLDVHSDIEQTTPAKKRKLNKSCETSTSSKTEVKPDTNECVVVEEEVPKKRKRGRPRKHPEKVTIKKEKKETKSKSKSKPRGRPGRKKKSVSASDDEAIDMEYYLSQNAGGESYVGIRTEDGEVRVQIPPSKKTEDFPKVKYSVFGNACSDKIEDILQPKKRTRYVRGLSEEEKKTRRREQNRNAAARSRARKNAMISKVIQLHQENMGLRAFVAENITQTKILREELNKLRGIIMQQQHQMHHSIVSSHQSTPPLPEMPGSTSAPQTSSLFDIINQDSSTLFQEE